VRSSLRAAQKLLPNLPLPGFPVFSGYDGTVLNAAFGIDTFLSDMDDPDSSKQGLLIGAISLGYLAGFLPASWAGDRYGRKWPQMLGTVVILAGVFVQTFAIGGWKCKISFFRFRWPLADHSFSSTCIVFGGRMLLGFGNAFPLTLGCTRKPLRQPLCLP
jgi:MFS family permease